MPPVPSRRAGRMACAATLLLGLAACSDAQPTRPGSSSYLAARVRGAVSVDYLGTGWFHLGSVPQRAGSPVMFTLMSESTGGDPQVLQLFGELAGLPQPGTYPLGLEEGRLRAAFYSRTGEGGEALEAFAAARGELRVTAASPDRVQGEFHFVGFQYCDRDSLASETSCLVPGAPLQAAAQIEVSGSFTAERFRGTLSGAVAPEREPSREG